MIERYNFIKKWSDFILTETLKTNDINFVVKNTETDLRLSSIDCDVLKDNNKILLSIYDFNKLDLVEPMFDYINSLFIDRNGWFPSAMKLLNDVNKSNTLKYDEEYLIKNKNSSFITLDSRIKNDKEINVRVEGDKAVRLSVKYKNYTGVYAGVIKFSKENAKLFINLIDGRIKRGFNDSNSYYFAPLRNMINKFNAEFYAFDFAGYDWAEIDYSKDIEAARQVDGQTLTKL